MGRSRMGSWSWNNIQRSLAAICFAGQNSSMTDTCSIVYYIFYQPSPFWQSLLTRLVAWSALSSVAGERGRFKHCEPIDTEYVWQAEYAIREEVSENHVEVRKRIHSPKYKPFKNKLAVTLGPSYYSGLPPRLDIRHRQPAMILYFRTLFNTEWRKELSRRMYTMY